MRSPSRASVAGRPCQRADHRRRHHQHRGDAQRDERLVTAISMPAMAIDHREAGDRARPGRTSDAASSSAPLAVAAGGPAWPRPGPPGQPRWTPGSPDRLGRLQLGLGGLIGGHVGRLRARPLAPLPLQVNSGSRQPTAMPPDDQDDLLLSDVDGGDRVAER